MSWNQVTLTVTQSSQLLLNFLCLCAAIFRFSVDERIKDKAQFFAKERQRKKLELTFTLTHVVLQLCAMQ